MKLLIQLIFASYFFQGFQLFAIGTFGVTSTEILLLMFYLVILKRVIWDGDEIVITKNYALIFLLLLAAAAILSGITPLLAPQNDKLLQYFKSTSHFLFKMSFTLVCFVYPFKSEFWTSAIKTWIVFSILINVFAVYQILARAYDLPLAWIQLTNQSLTLRGEAGNIKEITQLSLRFENFFRATSIFSEPSALAQFNLYIFSFLLIPYVKTLKPFFKHKFFNIFVMICAIIALLLAFSLTGALGCFIIIMSIIFIERRRILKFILPSVIGLLTLLIITDAIITSYVDISVISLFSQRIESIVTGRKDNYISGESFDTRKESGVQSINIWKENPVLGCGLGLSQFNKNYEIVYSDYSALAALSEMGLAGISGFAGLFAVLLVMAFKISTNKSFSENLTQDEKKLSSIVLYILLMQTMFNFITTNIFISIQLWVPMGMAVSIIMYIYRKKGAAFYSIRLAPIPVKTLVSRALNKYNSIQS